VIWRNRHPKLYLAASSRGVFDCAHEESLLSATAPVVCVVTLPSLPMSLRLAPCHSRSREKSRTRARHAQTLTFRAARAHSVSSCVFRGGVLSRRGSRVRAPPVRQSYIRFSSSKWLRLAASREATAPLRHDPMSRLKPGRSLAAPLGREAVMLVGVCIGASCFYRSLRAHARESGNGFT